MDNRKYNRISIDSTNSIFFIVDDNEFQVLDISPVGVRIKADSYSRFSLTQILDNCKLDFAGSCLQPIQSRVVHFIAQPQGGADFGIQFTYMDKSISDQLVTELQKLADG